MTSVKNKIFKARLGTVLWNSMQEDSEKKEDCWKEDRYVYIWL